MLKGKTRREKKKEIKMTRRTGMVVGTVVPP